MEVLCNHKSYGAMRCSCWAGYICGVFFFLGPCLATLPLPFLFLPSDGVLLFCVRGFLAGGGGVSSESGWVRLGCLRVRKPYVSRPNLDRY